MTATTLTLIGGPANLTQLAVPGMPSGIYRIPVWEAIPSTFIRNEDPYKSIQEAEYEVHQVTAKTFVGIYQRTV